jgi:hypothetical protein
MVILLSNGPEFKHGIVKTMHQQQLLDTRLPQLAKFVPLRRCGSA